MKKEKPKKEKKVKKPLSDAELKQRRKSRRSTVILFLVLLLGLAIMAYPTFSDWWNQFHQSRAIATYASVVEETDHELLESMLADAEAYNERLLYKSNRYELSDEEIEEYESLLDLSGNGVIGYIQINSIGVSLPIYHGTDESVLQIAVGHIQGTSLPVGGTNTHAVMSGHRGLPSARLFTDLDKLVEGDTFTITVLDRTLLYEVDQIRIVEPTDMSDLNIIAGEDYVTLVTCTPYGVNTHRLLVRGHQIEGAEEEVVVVGEAVQIPNYIAVPVVGIPILLLFLIGMLVYYRERRPRFDEEHILETISGEVTAEMAQETVGESSEAEDEAPQAPAEAAPHDSQSSNGESTPDEPVKEPAKEETVEEPTDPEAAEAAEEPSEESREKSKQKSRKKQNRKKKK